MGNHPVRSGVSGAVEPTGLACDVPTWSDVYRAERDSLVRLAYLMTGSQVTAEDLVQDTFIRVMARLEPDASPGAYLRRSVINACWSYHRRAWREVRPGDDRLDSVAGRAGPGRAGGPARDEGGDVDMWDALDHLAPRRRTILVMRYYLDMTEAEVAALLGCRVGTVKSTTHRALADLRKMIER
jgi:RNA polymerase sigma factor (sigma-70 family)